MQNPTIKIDPKTKGLLKTVARGGETYDDTIRRLIGIVQALEAEPPKYAKKGAMEATTYERKQRTYTIRTQKGSFRVVCVFNDLQLVGAVLRSPFVHTQAQFQNWEVDLQLLNIQPKPDHRGLSATQNNAIHQAWISPETYARNDELNAAVLYFKTLAAIIEETLFVSFHTFVTDYDYLSYDNWRDVYAKNHLSQESLHTDIEKKLRDVDRLSIWLQ
jgi:hypothetical protein